MILPSTSQHRISTTILLTFCISWAFLLYIALTSHMIIFHDSLGYESLGKAVHEQGWEFFFKTGPQREPIYFGLIALSMSIAQQLAIPSYQPALMLLQLLLLMSTQVLAFLILRKIKVHDYIIAGAILYLGFSPVIVNSAFILWSEIVTYPLMLLLILAYAACLHHIQQGPHQRLINSICLGSVFGLLLVLNMFVKGAFEIIAPALMLPIFMKSVQALRLKQPVLFKRSIVVLCACLFTFYAPILSYKWANLKYNGNFTFTSRVSSALYGNIARRMATLDSKKWLAALAYVLPNEELCHRLYGQNECFYWGEIQGIIISKAKEREFDQQNLTLEQRNKDFIKLSLQKVTSNPLQYVSLAFLEGLKMVFWEGMGITYIVYPNLVAQLYAYKPLEYALKYGMPIVTVWALVYLTTLAWTRRKQTTEAQAIIFALFNTLVIYIGAYTPFFIHGRYALPIAPLYVICIALWLNSFLTKKT